MRRSNNTRFEDISKTEMGPGGGGYVTGVKFTASGNRGFHGTDVGNAFYRDMVSGKRWLPIFSPQLLPTNQYDPTMPAGVGTQNGKAKGCCALASAPSDDNRFYGVFNDTFFRNDDGFATKLTVPSTQRFYFPTNAQYEQRLSVSGIEVHPTDKNTVLVGTFADPDTTVSGAFYSSDGGVTWHRLAGISAPVARGGWPGRYYPAFDPNGVDFYIFSDGVGLYHGTVGTWTMTLIAGSPTRALCCIVDANGNVFLGCGGTGGVTANDVYKRTRAGVATTRTSNCGQGAAFLDIKPENPNIIFACDPNADCAMSFDNSGSWTRFDGPEGAVINDLPGELLWQKDRHLFGAMPRFRPGTNELYLANGTGVAEATHPTSSAGSLHFRDFSRGNEMLISRWGLSIPGRPGFVLIHSWDYPCFKITNFHDLTNKPSNGAPGINIGSQSDHGIDNPSFVALVCTQTLVINSGNYVAPGGQGNVRFSHDAGDNFTAAPNIMPINDVFDMVAVSNQNNIIFLGAASGYFTKDGTTWSPVKLDGVNATTSFTPAWYIRRHVLAADKQVPGTFALVYKAQSVDNQRLDNPLGGLWVTKDGGSTWQHKITGVIGSSLTGFAGSSNDRRRMYQALLRYIPGRAGEILYSGHPDDGVDSWLFYMTGDGVTLAQLGDAFHLRNVTTFDCGFVPPGKTMPSVMFYGDVNGVKGLYISDDWFATAPVLVERFPFDNLIEIDVIFADRNLPDRWYIGGLGWQRYDRGKRLLVKAS